MGNGLQVFGVDAQPVAAEMVKGVVGRDLTHKEFVGDPVRADRRIRFGVMPQKPVALRPDSTRPLPAASGVYREPHFEREALNEGQAGAAPLLPRGGTAVRFLAHRTQSHERMPRLIPSIHPLFHGST